MTVKQISVFVENKPGQLAELTDVLNKKDVYKRQRKTRSFRSS